MKKESAKKKSKAQSPRQRRLAQRPGSKMVEVEMTFRCVEYHTIKRKVPELQLLRRDGEDLDNYLDAKFRDDDMADSDINTESFELDSWTLIHSNEKLSDAS